MDITISDITNFIKEHQERCKMKEGIEFCLKQLKYLEAKCEIFDMHKAYKSAVEEMKTTLLASLERLERGENPKCMTSFDEII